MMTLKAAHFPASKPSSSVARMRWPVEDTGRNSVTPSTIPRMMAIRRVDTSAGGRQVDPSSGEAVAPETVEPFAADRGERSWLDPEGLETRHALCRYVVALEHQPLVA